MFFILSQIAAFITLVAVVIGLQNSSKTKLLFWFTVANIFLVISYAFIGAWVGVALTSVMTVRTISFLFLEKYRDKIPSFWDVSILLVFLVVNVVVTYFTWTMWFDFVLLCAVLLHTFGAWSKGKHRIRIFGFLLSSLMLTYNIIVSNWTAIVVEAAVLVSVIIYYARFFHNNKKLLVTITNDIIEDEDTVFPR